MLLSWLIMRYQRVTSNVNNVQYNCGIIWKNQILKELHILVRSLKNIDNEPGDCISGVCKDFVIKLTIKFSTVVDKETT